MKIDAEKHWEIQSYLRSKINSSISNSLLKSVNNTTNCLLNACDGNFEFLTNKNGKIYLSLFNNL